MPLQSWIDNERTSSWVHSSDQLSVLDVLERKFVLVIPVLVVSVLSQQSDGILGVVRVSGWHVHVVHEVDQFVLAQRSVRSTCFLLQVLLQVQLQQVCVSVVVEVDDVVLYVRIMSSVCISVVVTVVS